MRGSYSINPAPIKRTRVIPVPNCHLRHFCTGSPDTVTLVHIVSDYKSWSTYLALNSVLAAVRLARQRLTVFIIDMRVAKVSGRLLESLFELLTRAKHIGSVITCSTIKPKLLRSLSGSLTYGLIHNEQKYSMYMTNITMHEIYLRTPP